MKIALTNREADFFALGILTQVAISIVIGRVTVWVYRHRICDFCRKRYQLKDSKKIST